MQRFLPSITFRSEFQILDAVSIPIARSITNDDSVALTRSIPAEYLAERQRLIHEVNLFKLFRMR
ncbi:MAG: hypothetical protein DMG54_34695 [Acidobacteria bacterium]|nr:MAG: hypothetical protein DMG41_37210 [Acidobacteriota bacterium]PYU37140.1 MAG: hypothetical protein DMG54_34695 [Acidobacteriota bacterium]PYU39820.1 MAG: hypothetical protein DMG53_23855 [Acidobacteriota bacterium]PYU70035.1 MAG: hypothetical protein DMG52_27000 [Acidobacteriota bacterium]